MAQATTKKKATAKKVAAKAGDTQASGYRITVKKDGFRRADRAWHGVTEIAADELTEEQLAALVADPMFEVEPMDT